MNPEPPPNPDADLEVRLTAWLLGELTETDAAPLARMVEQDPALRAQRDRLAATMPLVREAVRESADPVGATPNNLRLSPARREALRQQWGQSSVRAVPPDPPAAAVAPIPFWERFQPWIPLGMAAAFMLVLASTMWGWNGQPLMAQLGGVPPTELNFFDAAALQSKPAQVGSRGGALVEREPAEVQSAGKLVQDDRQRGITPAEGRLNQTALSVVPPTRAPAPSPGPEPLQQSLKRVEQEARASTAESLASLDSPTDSAATARLSDAEVHSFRFTLPEKAKDRPTAPASSPRRSLQLATDFKSTLTPDSNSDRLGRVAPAQDKKETTHSSAFFRQDGTAGASRAAGVGQALDEKAVTFGNGVIDASARARTLTRTNGPNLLALGLAMDDLAALRGQERWLRETESIPDRLAEPPRAPEAKQLGENLPVQLFKEATRPNLQTELDTGVTLAPALQIVAASVAAPTVTHQPETLATASAISTFSLNVSDVSYQLAVAALEQAKLPDPNTIRSEEFVNAFNYRDPDPPADVPIAFTSERARYPFAQQRDVLRLAVRTGSRGRLPGRPIHAVLLLDNSGSMERPDRVQVVREALTVLASRLKAGDKVSVVAFAQSPRLWVDALPGEQASQLVERVGQLTPEGGTHLEAALDLAYATAKRHFVPGGLNRIVLLTDGAANLGDVSPASLAARIIQGRRDGIALDCFGIGWEGLNDALLENLSRHGDGRYGFLNRPEAVATEFAERLAGAWQVAAADVKVQVEFNPRRVTRWRQVGYAHHQLTEAQFRDDAVDAAELAAAESGQALYLIEVDDTGTGPIGSARARYRDPVSNVVRELEWTISYRGPAPALDQAPPTLRLATAAAAFSEWLQRHPLAADVTLAPLLNVLRGVPDVFTSDPRPSQLEWMIRQAQSIAGP